MDTGQCAPTCGCDGDVFAPPTYTQDDLDAMRGKELLTPPDVPTDDPYTSTDPPPESDGVCAVLYESEDKTAYRLKTFPTAEDAASEGGFVTHEGACGLCSSLADLAVYIEIPDLTTPVRNCGITGVLKGEQADMDCLTDLGFTLPCARIWYYNTQNTKAACGDICTSLLGAPYLTPEGELNDCLQCDEDNSGPVFKAQAGRTRRNSGVPSALCRPCDTVARIVHDYL